VGTFHAGVNHTLTNDAFERAEGSEENVFEEMCALFWIIDALVLDSVSTQVTNIT